MVYSLDSLHVSNKLIGVYGQAVFRGGHHEIIRIYPRIVVIDGGGHAQYLMPTGSADICKRPGKIGRDAASPVGHLQP